jgi:phosphoenolpyruvate carboxylase
MTPIYFQPKRNKMSKQTAVNWLEEEINQQQKMYIDLAKKDKSLKNGVHAILTATTILKMKCEQAKQMEEQQTIDFAKDWWGDDSDMSAKEYYNETFNK